MRHLLPLQYVEAIAKHGSIRKAAEHLAITPSALNRRLISMEEELGVPLFERLPKGVRLSAAGEIMLGHIRTQISDLERVKSRIADLSGMRKGHVAIGCSAELRGPFLPGLIRQYQSEFPQVTFDVKFMRRGEVEDALIQHIVDVALVFEPLKLAEFQTLFNLQQQVLCCVGNDHNLHGKSGVRLYECCDYPLILPAPSSGIRQLLDNAAIRLNLNLSSSIQSNRPEFIQEIQANGDQVSFDLPINLADDGGKNSANYIAIDPRDVKPGFLFVGQLRGRALPVAAARFVEELVEAMANFDTGT